MKLSKSYFYVNAFGVQNAWSQVRVKSGLNVSQLSLSHLQIVYHNTISVSPVVFSVNWSLSVHEGRSAVRVAYFELACCLDETRTKLVCFVGHYKAQNLLNGFTNK